MRKYKLWIRKYNLFKNDYEVIEKIVTTNDIYHEIGYIYCTTIEEIKRIDYQEVKEWGAKMNREIKFRMWNDYDEKMIYWNELLQTNLANIFTMSSYNKWLMQYTRITR